MAMRLIYPPRCLGCGGLVETDFGLCAACWSDTPFIGGVVCDGCGLPLPGGQRDETAHCDECLTYPPIWTQGRAATMYAGQARKLVMALKHGDRHDIVAPAADWLAEAAEPLICQGMIVTAIPLHWRRRVMRGYNQSALLSRAVAKRLRERTADLDLIDQPDLLLRTRATASLGSMGREERHSVLSGAISINPRCRDTLEQRPVLIVDDVMTSGATFSAAAAACIAAGSGPVSVLALARVGKAS
ncbi:ComF family protein [Pseudooceanicola sediminis]|nr:double zinc ribbon domain-containing protein [Pseudooceanicola sediminis]|tara:strand:+ start:72651 stop:73382 length:732 start_codon:yes stop_codon:yes gene_type:complete